MPRATYREFAEMERQGWADAEVARNYADGFAAASEQCVPAMVRAVGAGPDTQALDLCCGQGIVAAGLRATGANVIGLDFSPAMLELARARAPGVEFVEGDAMELRFDAARFDAVTIGFGLLHVPDAVQVLTEVARVLRPGGRLAFSIWHAPSRPTALGYVFEAVARYGDPQVQLPPGPGLHDYADPLIVGPVLERTGFSEMQQQVVDSAWTIDAPDAPVTLFAEGTVRGRALLQRQPRTALEAIRKDVEQRVLTDHGPEGPWQVPIPAVITSATVV